MSLDMHNDSGESRQAKRWRALWMESLFVCMKVGFCRVEGSSVLLLCNLIGDSKLVNSICRPRLPKISGAGDSIPFGSQIKRESEREHSGNICCR